MQKKKNFIFALIGFLFTSVFGTLLHFLYEWSGNCTLLSPFSGINESTWEHMKIMFWPMFVYMLIECFFYKDRVDFFNVKLKGILLGVFLIPIIFYTYNGVFIKSNAFVNISIFYISAAIAYVYEYKKFMHPDKCIKYPYLPLVPILALTLSFITFTFFVPQFNIFLEIGN